MSPRTLRSSAPGALPQDDEIVRPDGSRLALRRYGGERRHEGMPLVLHFHAGAFIAGSLDEGATVAGLLAEAGALVLSLDYPLAPAHPFPQAVKAGYDALTWADQHRRRLATARAPIYVAGEEAGGNLAAAVAMVARDRAGPEIAGQILLSPMLDACVGTASQREAKAGPVGCRWADGWHTYLAREDDALHPYAVPARSMRLAGLPRTLLVSAADDPLRDETQAFAERLRTAHVPVELALLEVKTGWPLSYLQGGTPPWAEPLAARLRGFFSTAASAAVSPSSNLANSARGSQP
jgi:acetyl esterase